MGTLETAKYQVYIKEMFKKLYPYIATKPLQTIGCFTATVEASDKTAEAEFVVIEEKGEPLLSRSTAQELAVLHIGAHINSVQSYDNMKQEFPTVFHGVGKLEGRRVKLAVDKTGQTEGTTGTKNTIWTSRQGGNQNQRVN